MKYLGNFITTSILEFLNEQKLIKDIKLNDNFINDLKKELLKYKSDEDLLRGGGISIETLDRLAHGFSEEDIKTI